MIFLNTALYAAVPVLQTAIVLITLPLATLKVGADAYGLLAIVQAVSGLAIMLIGGPIAVLPKFYSQHDDGQINAYVLALTLYTTAAAIVFTGIVILANMFAGQMFTFFDILNGYHMTAIAILIVGQSIWALASMLPMLEGRAWIFMATQLSQVVATSGGTLFALFVLDMGADGLIAGAASGAVVAGLAGLIVLRPRLLTSRSADWATVKNASIASSLWKSLEGGYQFIEREMIFAQVGLGMVGVYSHSLTWRSMMLQLYKSVSRAVWPAITGEIKAEKNDFTNTRRATYAVRALLVISGLGFAALGEEIIGLLTHGKLAGAGLFLVFWAVWVVIQTAGQLQNAVLVARDDYNFVSHANTLGFAVAVAVLFLGFPTIGIYAAVAAQLAPPIVLRIALHVRIRRHAVRPPLADLDVPFVTALILSVGAAKYVTDWGLPAVLGLAGICAAGAIALYVILISRCRENGAPLSQSTT